jgi:hypothetical protein
MFYLINFITNRTLLEGIGLIIAGVGFSIFDITRAAGEELEDFKPFKYVIGLVFAGIVFLGLGVAILFVDEHFKHGITYVIAGISLIIYIIAWGKDFRILTVIATLFVLGSFLGLGIFSMLNIGITVTNISFIIFGIALTIFQIGAQTDIEPLILIGSIPLFGGTILLSGIFLIDGLTSIVNVIFATITDSALDFIINKNIIGAISFFVSGVGIIGIMLGLTFGGNSGRNKDRNIIGGISLIILGIGFIGVESVDIIYSGKSNQGVMFTVFSLGLILGVVCGINLIQLGRGMLSNDAKLSMNNWGGVVFGFIGLFIQWLIDGEYFLGIGSILFLVTMLLLLLANENRKVILIVFPVFIISSLFFGGIFIYSGVNILL